MLILTLLFGIAMIVIGVISVCKPDTVWELRESWKYKHRYSDEPSELYQKLTKLSGFFLIAAGLFFVVLSIILLIQ